MDRERIEREMRALEKWMPGDNPPLMAVVVQANGAGLAFTYPLMEMAKDRGDPSEIHAVLGVVRHTLLDLAATLQVTRIDLERRGL